MSLTLNKNGNDSAEGYMGDGIYVDEAEVVKVTNVTEEEAGRGYRYDLAILAECKLVKNGWDRKVTIGGNFKKDKQTGKIEDWGGAFKIRDFFSSCNVKGDFDDNGKPTAQQIEDCKGNVILLLTYPNIKGKRSVWNCVTYATRDKESFKSFFLKGAQNLDETRRYPKNYQSPDTDPQPVSEEMQKAMDSSDLNTDML